MQTIGLIGGMSWHSTAEYYRIINEQVAARRGGHASAKVALQSLDFDEVRACQTGGDWDRAGRLLAEAGQRCEQAGADVVLICTNTMHLVADDVQAALGVPLLHIADAIADRAREQGWSRLGLLATRFVMDGDFYVDRLASGGMTVALPTPDARTEVDRVIFEELTLGRVEPRSRATYCGIIDGMRDAGAQAAVLGCTEIELLVGPEDSSLPVIDSMRTHAEAAVAVALGDRVLV